MLFIWAIGLLKPVLSAPAVSWNILHITIMSKAYSLFLWGTAWRSDHCWQKSISLCLFVIPSPLSARGIRLYINVLSVELQRSYQTIQDIRLTWINIMHGWFSCRESAAALLIQSLNSHIPVQFSLVFFPTALFTFPCWYNRLSTCIYFHPPAGVIQKNCQNAFKKACSSHACMVFFSTIFHKISFL